MTIAHGSLESLQLFFGQNLFGLIIIPKLPSSSNQVG
jgi:hypothetical protein